MLTPLPFPWEGSVACRRDARVDRFIRTGTAHSFDILATADATVWVGPGLIPGWAFMGLFRNNGTVFNAGTTDWVQGLRRFVESGAAPNTVCRITENVMRRMSAPRTAAQRAARPVYR